MQKQADDRVAQYFDFLQKNGIEKKDIDAANLSTQPEYDYTKEGKSVLKGYRAVRQVEVTLRQLDKLNELLDGALKSGLNEIRSVELGVANADSYKDQARKAAIANATQQASARRKASTPNWARCTAFAITWLTTSRCRWRACTKRPVPQRTPPRSRPTSSRASILTIRWMWYSKSNRIRRSKLACSGAIHRALQQQNRCQNAR